MNFQNLLALFGIGSMVAGTITSTVSAHREAKAERQAAEYQAAVANNNAQLAEWEAQDALFRGGKEEQRHRLNVAALKGTQRATMASRGIVMSEGSPLRILTDTDFMGELDARVIRMNAEREAWSRRNQAQQYQDDAAWMRASGRSRSPTAAAATTLLSGATAVASRWYNYSGTVDPLWAGDAGYSAR